MSFGRRSWALTGAGLILAGLAISVVTTTNDNQQPGRQAIVPAAEAPNTDAALAAARRQKSPVVVSALTTDTRLVRARPDGSLEASLSIQPGRFQDRGRWVEVDTTLVHRPNGTVGPRAVSRDVSFSGGGAQALVAYGPAGQRMALTWPRSLPTPALSGSEATYAEVYPGVDLVMRATPTGYAQRIVVKDAAAARRPDVARMTMGLVHDGLDVKAAADGSLAGVGRDGTPVFAAPP